MITMNLDEAQMDLNIRKLARIYGVSIQQELRKQARLVLKDCVKLTPPMTWKGASKQSFQTQKKIGENAVKRDVRRVFKSYADFEFLKSDSIFSKTFRRILRQGKLDGAMEMLRRTRLRTKGVIESATRQLHRQARFKRGRVPKNQFPYIVRDESSIGEVLRFRLSMVGRAKSGWVKAAVRLGLSLPAWIHKGGAGSYQEIGGEKPSISVSNNVTYAQEAGLERRIVETAMRDRMIKMQREVEHATAASLRRGGIPATVT